MSPFFTNSTIDAHYFFEDQERWNLFFATPNQAGLFLASIIPFFWLLFLVAPKNRLGKAIFIWGFFAVELCFWFVLSKTYSRGALLGLGAAAALGIWLWLTGRGNFREYWQWLVSRAAAVMAIILFTHFGDRLAPGLLVEDHSVTHRLDLWTGGLKMIAVSPWHGWGAGQSGAQYMQWFQPVDATTGYASMVNSLLTLTVERGLPAFSAYVFVSVFVILGGVMTFNSISTEKSFLRFALLAATASFVAFSIACLFSNFWVAPSLWTIPVLEVLFITTVYITSAGDIRRVAFWSGAGTGALSIILLCVGTALHSTVSISLSNSSIIVENRGDGPISRIVLLTDPDVLGDDYGKQARQLAQSIGSHVEVIVVPPGQPVVPELLHKAAVVIATGSTVDLLPPRQTFTAPLIILHPTKRPDSVGLVAGDAVILPEIEQSPFDSSWQKASILAGLSPITDKGVGTDVRLNWPDVTLNQLRLESALR